MRPAVLLALLALAACGRQGPLERDGRHVAVVPLGASAAPTPTQMLELPVEARPTRVDDPLKRSEERQDDRFDLPPPG